MSSKIQISPLSRTIINYLSGGPLTRQELVALTKKSRTTIYDNLLPLLERDWIIKYKRLANERGRPQVYFKLTDEFHEAENQGLIDG